MRAGCRGRLGVVAGVMAAGTDDGSIEGRRPVGLAGARGRAGAGGENASDEGDSWWRCWRRVGGRCGC